MTAFLSEKMSEPQQPPWIRVRVPRGGSCKFLRDLKSAAGLNTVCESALCPNIGECWRAGHATFMIMGNGCTRNCAFCGVGNEPEPVCKDEPRRVAEAVRSMNLRHAVVTSVTRDDLADGGAGYFAATIRELRKICPDTSIEVLIPDFGGSRAALETVLAAGPDIMGHNMETVCRLYSTVRPGADYRRSLALLARAGRQKPSCITKSGLMLGLGETRDEIEEIIRDIRGAGVQVLTIGQYLRPGRANIAVAEYVHPETFARIQSFAKQQGFSWVAAGPLVRSSYQAASQARALGIAYGCKNGSSSGVQQTVSGSAGISEQEMK